MTGYRRSDLAYAGGSHTTRSRRLPSSRLSTPGTDASAPCARCRLMSGHSGLRRWVTTPRASRSSARHCHSTLLLGYPTACVRRIGNGSSTAESTRVRGGVGGRRDSKIQQTARRRCGRNSAWEAPVGRGFSRSAPHLPVMPQCVGGRLTRPGTRHGAFRHGKFGRSGVRRPDSASTSLLTAGDPARVSHRCRPPATSMGHCW